MKLIAAVLSVGLLLLAGCSRRAERSFSTSNPEFTVDFLFEKDGIKVYRFIDDGRSVYFTDARGCTSTTLPGKGNIPVRVETVR